MSDNRFVRDIYQDTLQQTTIENLKFYETEYYEALEFFNTAISNYQEETV